MEPNTNKPKQGADNTPKLMVSETSINEEATKRVVLDDFDKARKYVKDNYQEVWSNCFKAYNNIRSIRGYSGVADDFIPETFSIVESLKSAIAGTKPKFKYMPLREEQEQDTTVLNSLVDFYWSCNNMTEKVMNWVQDMIVYGNGIFMVSWDGDKPLIQHIPLSDFFVDPTATHINRPEEPGYARYAGYRYLTSKAQLNSEYVIDRDSGELVPKYKNLDTIGDSDDEGDTLDKDRKEKYIGSTLGKDALKEQVEVIVYFTRRKKIMVANRSVVIYEDENPYHRLQKTVKNVTVVNGQQVPGKMVVPEIQGFLPFAILRNYVDSNLFFARGDVELILPTQEALNDTASQKRDNLAYALNNMWQIDPRFKHLAEQIESIPGAIFPIPKGALTALEKQDISPAADTELARLTQVMRTATAADAAVQGVSQKFSRTTATEVQAQLNQASMRFTTKVQNLEDEGFAQLARIIFKMIQIFVDQPTAVRIVGNDGVKWKTYAPDTYNGEYEPRVILESTANAEKHAMAQSISAVLQFGLNNPLVNQTELLRQAFKNMLDIPKDELEQLLTPPAPPVMGPDGQAVDPTLTQGNAQMTPGATAAMTTDPNAQPAGNGYRRFSDTTRGRASQTGTQGGGGAGTSPGNGSAPKRNQPSTVLPASSRPKF